MRDQYLSNYQGIIFSTENLSFATTVIMEEHDDKKKLNTENSFFKNRFLCLSALNSANLFQIRNKKLDKIRKQDGKSMDNYNYFCRFFGVDEQTKAEFGNLTSNFKTLFPAYVLQSEYIQHAITQATGGYESFFDFQTKSKAEEPHLNACIFGAEGKNFQALEEDLNFRECDTIAMIELMEYGQNEYIEYRRHDKEIRDEQNSNVSNDQMTGAPIRIFESGTDAQKQISSFHQNVNSKPGHGGKHIEDSNKNNQALRYLKEGSLSLHYQIHSEKSGSQKGIFVRHLLDVKNTRFLYTKRVYELLHHHLVKGFEYKKYRKTDYIDVDRHMKKKRNFLDGFKQNDQNYLPRKTELNRNLAASPQMIKGASEQKDAFIGIRLINPQVNMQD